MISHFSSCLSEPCVAFQINRCFGCHLRRPATLTQVYPLVQVLSEPAGRVVGMVPPFLKEQLFLYYGAFNTGIERNITLFKTFCSASFQPQIAVKVCTSFFVFWQLNCLLMSQLILRRGAEMIMHPRLHFRCVNKHYLTSGLTSGNLPMCSRLISLSETECCTSKASLPLLITCSVSG